MLNRDSFSDDVGGMLPDERSAYISNYFMGLTSAVTKMNKLESELPKR